MEDANKASMTNNRATGIEDTVGPAGNKMEKKMIVA
jgi:hypothetical protein